MKIEPRGKYPGIKIHLDEKEVEEFIGLNPDGKATVVSSGVGEALRKRLRTKVKDLLHEVPWLLKERTSEQIIAELTIEKEKSEKKLAAIAAGKDWKEVKL